MNKKRYIYFFSKDHAEGTKLGKFILGGKGANLIEMAQVGIPVPPGLVISTEACNYYLENEKLPNGFVDELQEKLEKLAKTVGATFAGKERPLLVSIRSGSPVSMPGMMDTILNLGLHSENIDSMIQATNNKRFVYDSYRRFIQMYSNVVLNTNISNFEKVLSQTKQKHGIEFDHQLTEDHLQSLIEEYLHIVKKLTGKEFPNNPEEQLLQAIISVFKSWNNQRAIYYRKLHNIPRSYGTAVSVQSMVFGNMGASSATGVAFTRNPGTGENHFYGEYLTNAQGEDVVAGIRTPKPISELKIDLPKAYDDLYKTQELLENHFKDMQDIEFTIQQGKLYILQTRNGKRTGVAALRIAVEMVKEKKISQEKALSQIDPNTLPSLLAPIFDKKEKAKLIAKTPVLAIGLNAGPGCASGLVVFNAKTASQMAVEQKKSVILVREETSPEDIIGMQHANGIVTARGGMTSHAAVVARGMNKPCIVGCSALHIDEKANHLKVTIKKDDKPVEMIINEGDEICIDGNTGEIMLGWINSIPSEIENYLNHNGEKTTLVEYFIELLKWTDKYRRLEIRANADTPKDSQVARNYGAQGIGLCRTEHMFFQPECLLLMQCMILADNSRERKLILDQLLKFQLQDFIEIFRVMTGLPVTIRLLDPPLHEFLPHSSEQDQKLAKKINISPDDIKIRSQALREENPMLGHRGCRLGITFPEITQMQTQAILEAAIVVQKEGLSVHPEIMIPLVGDVAELALQKEVILKTADEVFRKKNASTKYSIGTMIEVPRAALQAGKISKLADFFSFGTNDLTQMTLAFSRDDAGVFISEYIDKNIYEVSPFESIDQEGVGELVRIACQRGRATKKNLKLGICGEHGGDPASIHFFNEIGLDYVSCSPFRIAIARLAAAQAVIKQQQKK